MNKKLVIKDLNIEHLADVLRLQDKIIAGFHEDEKHFVLKRSVEDFMYALDSENTHMIGVFDGDKLVAQSIFEFPQDNQKRDLEEFAKDVPNSDLVIYKATLVDKDYRGLGLMSKLLEYREAKAKEAGKKVAINQIAIDNPSSWINALKNGMSIRKVDNDPVDNAKVLYLQKEFYDEHNIAVQEDSKFSMYIGKDIHKEIPALFNKMRHFVASGYRGIKLDKTTNSIVWSKPVKQKHKEFHAIAATSLFAGVRDKTIRS